MRFKSKLISKEQIKYLENIGFEWNVVYGKAHKNWEEMLETLKKYKEEHGDCNVPTDWENPKLVNWVRVQRNNHRNNQLNQDHIKRLDEIGFVWDPQWDVMFKVLKEYKEEYGDFNITTYWIANKQLARWVSKQRVNYRRMKLGKEQIKRLEEIGFEWKIRE